MSCFQLEHLIFVDAKLQIGRDGTLLRLLALASLPRKCLKL